MKKPNIQFFKRSPLKVIFYLMMISWTALIMVENFVLHNGIQVETEKLAKKEAYKGYEKDIMFRTWASVHGGVYVPITERTPPNPYLAGLPERDITTPSKKKLTLLNPDYVNRQIHELSSNALGIKGHITSLHPVRKENAADRWETEALKSFENGTKEIYGFDTLENEKHLRYMAPLYTIEACLKCHAAKGYRTGDILGGISSSVPWKSYEATISSQTFEMHLGFGILWVIGMIGLVLAKKRFGIYIKLRDLDELETKKLNEELLLSKSLIEENLFQNNLLIEELTDTKDKLEKINSEKDKFFSIIAHDLRSPFQGFLGLTETMAADINSFSPDDLVEISYEMHKSANNLFKLLKNLLEWAQVQNGTVPFAPDNYSLLDAVKQSIETVEQRAFQKGVNIINRIPATIYVYVDDKMLNTILRNLLSNAVKFTDTNGKIILSAKAIENNMAEISVSDSGIGISEEEVINLFRLDKKVSHKGTKGEESCGLGLVLCKEFVEKNGGEFRVESRLGKGSTFYFTLKISGL